MFITQDKKNNRPPISTFDVFDTVITRAVVAPAAVYLLLGRRLSSVGLVNCTPEAFAHARADQAVQGEEIEVRLTLFVF